MQSADAMPARVAVFYNAYPHYRSGIVRSLGRSTRFHYVFFGDLVRFDGIEPMSRDQFHDFRQLRFHRRGPFAWQVGAIGTAWRSDFDAVVFLANPYYLSTWVAALAARAAGKKVLFWAHGWLGPEPRLKRMVRRLFFGLGDVVLVYGERARLLGAAAGFDPRRIVTVYNSLDDDRIRPVRDAIGAAAEVSDREVRGRFAHPSRPLVICTARLTAACRFELLIEAARLLRSRGAPINILLVGDGAARAALEAHARRAGVDVLFWGACYDEAILGRLLHAADVTVSPGKIGLTAIHSLHYGTPAISHDNLDAQMPEVEAIVPGRSGQLFHENDSTHLADTIAGWLGQAHDRAAIRRHCHEVVDRLWNADNQRRCIEAALQLVGIGA